MHRTLVTLVTVVTFSLALAPLGGCHDPSPPAGLGDAYPAPLNDPQIAVLDKDLRPWLAFHPAVIIRAEGAPLEVEIPVRNTTDRAYLIDYRILFYDERGVEETPTMPWTFTALEPKQTQRLKSNALGTDSVTHKIEVRWSR